MEVRDLRRNRRLQRPSIVSHMVGQVLRPSLAPSTVYSEEDSTPTPATGLARQRRAPSTPVFSTQTAASSPFWRASGGPGGGGPLDTTNTRRQSSSLSSDSDALHRLKLPSEAAAMPDRVGSASSSRFVGGVDPSTWSASRRTSAILNRRGTYIYGSAIELGDRTSSKLTLDEELYDLLFAYGEAELGLGGAGLHEADKEAGEEDASKPMTRQLLLDKIRQKKEVINKLRCQAWSMNRKRRTLRLAQKYLEQHESKVSKTHLYREELSKRFRSFRRWASNINTYLIPWESKIKKIESHFGTVVSSYFTFLRWVIYMNLIITLLILSFVTIPELIADATANPGRQNRTQSRKEIPVEERVHADEMQRVFHFDGYFRYSSLFYGYYSNDEYVHEGVNYDLPLAYFVMLLVIFGYSFFVILKKMASNARMSKMGGSKNEQYIFNWKVFTGWDYSIGNAETAANNVMAAVIKLREATAESHVKKHEKVGWLTIFLRVLANMIILFMIGFSIYCISFAFNSSSTVETAGNLFNKNQVPSVMSTITHVFPMIFDLVTRMESWHPRFALRLHLARVLVLYILNYCTFIYVLYEKYIRNAYDLKLHAVTFAEEEEDIARLKRQLGGRNENMQRPPPFASRNFVNRRQVMEFFNKTAQRVPESLSSTQQPTLVAKTTPNSTAVTVQSQFGPFGVNYAKALVRNTTLSPQHRRFETRKLGPPPLPVFSPPPQRRRPVQPVGREHEFGPHWSAENTTDDDGTDSASNVSLGGQERITTEEQVNSNICWETMVGQEIVKLVTIDLYITIGSILVIDFLRGLWIKYCSSWWCWDIETKFPEYGEFKVAENVLHIINNQGLIWLGFFFAPMLPAINNVKLIILVYIRSWAVMTCNVPAREIFRASRSSNFYLWILLLWLVFCTVPVGIAIGSTRPSNVCGPFAGERYFYSVFIKLVEQKVDKRVLNILKLFMNPGVIVPVLLFLGLIIYFLICLVRGLRRANNELQDQLTHERTEEKKKIFEMAGGGKKKAPNPRGGKKHASNKLGQYLPNVEQKRREPWRIFNGTDQTSSVCVTDEPDSSTQSLGNSPVLEPRSHVLITDELQETSFASPFMDHKLPSGTRDFRPSLGSLDEVENSEDAATVAPTTMPTSVSKPSMTVSRSGQTDRADDWFNEEEIRSDHSYDIQSAAVEIATPDDVRAAPLRSRSPGKGSQPVLTTYPAEPRRIKPSPSPAPVAVSVANHNARRGSREALTKKQEEVASFSDKFKPWPSIEEIRAQRGGLLPVKPPAPRAKSPPKMMRSVVANSVPPVTTVPAPVEVAGPPGARFRISVSPTRKIVNSDSDTGSTGNKIVIKQRVLPGSANSIASRSSRGSSSSARGNRTSTSPRLLTPRAPRVEFGDDDSPRLQDPPPVPPHR